ncbi:MAG: hypothetical protein ACTHMB_18355 [Candidatus Binatia bacterium]
MEETSQDVRIIALYHTNKIPGYRKQAGDNIVCWRTGAFAFTAPAHRQGQGKQLAIRVERAPFSVRFKWVDKNASAKKR